MAVPAETTFERALTAEEPIGYEEAMRRLNEARALVEKWDAHAQRVRRMHTEDRLAPDDYIEGCLQQLDSVLNGADAHRC